MNKSFPDLVPAAVLALLLAASGPRSAAQDEHLSPLPAGEIFVPPTPEAAAAAGLLPPDKVIVGSHHRLLDRWTKAFGLTEEQRLWIEPQLHAEESLTKPVLGYKALNKEERRRILEIIKLAARRQVRILLTPGQQKLMDKEIAATESGAK
jgi:hypothetical protein